MSISLGYWPEGSTPRVKPCGPMMRPRSSIELPGRYAAAAAVDYCDEKVIDGDQFTRAALETLRDSYHNMPTGSVHELTAFFSKRNYDHLAREVKRLSGYDIDKSELFDQMILAFTLIAPRSDITDMDRRLNFSPAVTSCSLSV